MKIIKNLFGIIAASAIIVSFAACSEDSEDPPPTPPNVVVPSGNLGATLTFTNEQVYTVDYSTFEFSQYAGAKTLTSDAGGTPTITSGKFSYTVGTPATTSSFDTSIFDGDKWTAITAVPSSGVTMAPLVLQDSDSQDLMKMDVNVNQTTMAVTQQALLYLYVNKDVVISGRGQTGEEDGMSYTSKDFSLSLKQGWNAINTKAAVVNSSTPPTATISMAVEHPDIKWVLLTE